MTLPEPPRGGRRRAPREPFWRPESLRRLVPPLVAVSAVLVVIVLLLVLNQRPTSGPGPTVSAGSTPSSAATPSPRPTTPARSPSPTPGRSAKPKPPASVPAARPSTTRTSARPVAKVPVLVLNNSRRRGLAHDTARQVASAGWPVAGYGNFSGRIPESTVYYAPGRYGAAQAFAQAFPAVQRVRPRFSTLPGDAGLTLVVTRDWPAPRES